MRNTVYIVNVISTIFVKHWYNINNYVVVIRIDADLGFSKFALVKNLSTTTGFYWKIKKENILKEEIICNWYVTWD